MSLSTESSAGESGHSTPTQGAAGPSAPLLTGVSGDRCTNCNARLAIDQRYCVECGTRRGNQRFTLAQTPSEGGPPTSAAQIGSAAVTRLQALLALVLILLAVGVGVLIGQGAARAPKLIVSGGSGSQTPAAKSSGSGSGSTSTKTGSGSGSSGNLFNSGS